MKIAVDAMGGDHAPSVVVEGGLLAARKSAGAFEIVFVGDQALIEAEILRFQRSLGELPISICHAAEKIEMEESPATALKNKPDASIVVSQRMHSHGDVQAVVSVGHTGAAMASALLILGRLPGIHRPAVGSFLPSRKGTTFILDVGAVVDARPRNLLQFAVMGSIFLERVVGVESPRVGLLSVGSEKSKGNEATLSAYSLLECANLNFVGNIEGGDILEDTVDVVVCDGFVGNVVLKFAEGVGGIYNMYMKRYIGKKIVSNIGAFLLEPTFKGLKKIWSYEEYGGAPLLGVNGVVVVGHGRSTPRAVMNAIQEAAQMVEQRINDKIKTDMEALQGEESGR